MSSVVTSGNTFFFVFGEPGDFHDALWHLVLGSYLKHHSLSTVTIESKNLGFLLVVFNEIFSMFNTWLPLVFCSPVWYKSRADFTFVHKFINCIPGYGRFFTQHSIFKLTAIALCTFSTSSLMTAVFEIPDFGSSSMSSLPSLKQSYHIKTCICNRQSSP